MGYSNNTRILSRVQRWLVQTSSKTYGDGPRVTDPGEDMEWRT